MKIAKKMAFYFCLALCTAALFGCSKKADENKPISEIKTEAEQMSLDQLRSAAMSYKDAILAQKTEVEKFAAKLKDIPVTKMLSTEAKDLKTEINTLNKSISALTDRFKIYYQKLKEKGGNLAGLDI